MPIYEYACEKCGTFEVSQRITEKPLRRCPTCKGKVRKLISSTSFQLKGSGWYVTDYAGKNATAKAKDEGGEKKGESSDAPKESSDGAKGAKDASSKDTPSKSSKSDGKKTEATAA
jgi:putative FmdB family regulatory protein